MPDHQDSALLAQLTEYTKNELLGGQGTEDLTSTTPLLEWGILNSVQTARLVAYIREDLGVRIPPTQIVSRNFRNLETITELVSSLRAAAI